MNSKPQSQTVGASPLSRREQQIKKALDKQSRHQAIVAMGPAGHVKLFRSSNIGTQVKQVRHGNHMKIEVYGVWWCQDEPSAKALKYRLDSLLKDTYESAEGAGYYQVALPTQMVQVAVELSAGETGVIIFSSEQREEWLLHQVKKIAAKPPRGF